MRIKLEFDGKELKSSDGKVVSLIVVGEKGSVSGFQSLAAEIELAAPGEQPKKPASPAGGDR